MPQKQAPPPELIDSVATIAHYANLALSKYGIEPIETGRYRYLAGRGIERLLRGALAERKREGDEALYKSVYRTYDDAYNANPCHLTRIFDGMKETLDALKERGIGLAVVSNKPDFAAALPKAHINACTAFFSRGVIGLCDSCRIAADVDRDYRTRRELINVYHQLPCAAIKYAANGVLFDRDPDVLYLRGEARMNEEQRRIWLSFVSLYGGTSGHSESPDTMEASPDTAVIGPQQTERGRPVYPCDGDTVGRFGYIARRGFGDFGVYLLWSDSEQDMPTALSPAEGAVSVSRSDGVYEIKLQGDAKRKTLTLLYSP